MGLLNLYGLTAHNLVAPAFQASPYLYDQCCPIDSRNSRSTLAKRFSNCAFSSTRSCRCTQRGQSRRNPGVKRAGVNVGDQSGDGVSDSLIACWNLSSKGTCCLSFHLRFLAERKSPGLIRSAEKTYLTSKCLRRGFRYVRLISSALRADPPRGAEWHHP